jgi:hypothetical protein
MLTAKEWKSRTFAAGHRRSPQLVDVDQKLEAYSANPSATKLNALCTAIEAWCATKSGYAKLLETVRNKSGAVQTLCTDVRQMAGKPAHWPDANKGSTYVVTLDESTVSLLRDLRFSATQRSVMMIAAMNVDWASFAFDQLESASGAAIGLGHTNYGSGWDNAQNNQTSLGQVEYQTAGKILALCLEKAGKVLEVDDRVELVLRGAGLSINIVLNVLKFHLFKDGVLSKAVPVLGPLKESIDTAAKAAVALRQASNSNNRVVAAKSMIVPTSDAATALESFDTLLKIETAKTVTNLAYRLLKDTALIVTEVLAMGAMTVVQVVTALAEVVVGFVYQLVYSLLFRKSVKKCREWVTAGASPEDLDFRSWIAGCPLLGAYFLVGLAGGPGAALALSMFAQPGEISSTDFQASSTKLLKVRQSAAAYVKDTPVKVKWTGPNGEKFKWIDGLVGSEAKSASVGLDSLKIHHWTLSEDADLKTRMKHKFHEHGGTVWSLGKKAWSVV